MKFLRYGMLCAAALVMAACTDEKIVYVDREPFNPPPDSITGFLGYFDVGTKKTSCGNCHVDHQTDWQVTAHSGAWASLQGSGHAQSFCSGCHSVSGRGNATVGAVGYDAVPDTAYHDVQCESCHGPGFDHASVPDVGPVPLARLGVRTADSAGTCGECHSGEHHSFADEWAQSRHAHMNTHATSSSCVACHEGRAVLRAWGMDANYVERSFPDDTINGLGITCAVCHDPHGSPNTAMLRFPISTPDTAQNLCMKCHMRRSAPYVNTRGNQPHAPQGSVFLGDAGWQNPSYLDTTLLNASSFATHASATANPRLCAGCHIYRFDVTDTAGGFVRTATGHLFRPIPCYDANGVPTDTIIGCAYNTTARTFKSCAGTGCHVTEAQAANLLSVTRTRMRDLSAQLWVDLDGDNTIDGFPVDTGYLPKIKANTLDLAAATAPVTAADGAEFNVRLVGEDLSGNFLYANGDKSHGVHNPFIAEALLRANIAELLAIYGPQAWFPAPSPAVQRILDGPLGVQGKYPNPVRASRRVATR